MMFSTATRPGSNAGPGAFVLVSWIAVLIILVAPIAVGQGATASASVTTGGVSNLTVGPFIAEPGARLAIELVCDNRSSYSDEEIIATACRITDESGSLAQSISITPPGNADALAWIAAVELIDALGDPLPAGRYRVTLETTIGTFTALVDIVPTHLLASHTRFAGTAIANGLSLRVSRLVTPDDAGRRIAMRLGDELLVALPGNPTTGFEWWNSVLYEYAVLRPIGEIPFDYRADVDPGLLGAPGMFLFRYQSVAADSQWFRFVYHRPWESVQPAEVLEFTAVVY